MSYIKINLGGADRGLKYNQGALITFQNYVDKDNVAATTPYALVWAGLKANAYVKREEVDFTFEQVCDWVDALNNETLLEVIKCFQETQAFKDLLPVEEEVKKKLPRKSMKSSA